MDHSAVITREPVVNKKRAITANRLIIHAANVGALAEALSTLDENWPNKHPVFLCLARLVPTIELMDWKIPDNVLVEIPVQSLTRPQTQNLLPLLDDNGISTCLSWFAPGSELPAQSDWRFVLMDARKQPSPTCAPGIPLAWGLHDPAAFEEAIFSGYEGASGWFFLHGKAEAGTLTPGHSQLVRLISLVRANADIREIESILKQDVAISYKLLRYINSAGFGLMCEIQSFRHAITILGYSNLSKWLSMLLVTASRDPAAQAVMQTSITRGRFMEDIGSAFFSKAEHDNLFITGAFSLLPALLGASMQSVLDEMSLPQNVTDALLFDEGEFAPFLRLAKATEGFDPAPLRQKLEELHLEPAQVNRALLSALAFADDLQS